MFAPVGQVFLDGEIVVVADERGHWFAIAFDDDGVSIGVDVIDQVSDVVADLADWHYSYHARLLLNWQFVQYVQL